MPGTDAALEGLDLTEPRPGIQEPGRVGAAWLGFTRFRASSTAAGSASTNTTADSVMSCCGRTC